MRRSLTWAPTWSTRPAPAWASTPGSGNGVACERTLRSVWHMPTAVILTISSSARGSPISTSSSWKGPSFDPTTAAVTFIRVLSSKAGLSRSRGLPDDLRVGLVLLKLLQSAQAVQTAEAALSETAFLELVGDEGPGVGPHGAGAQIGRAHV